MVALKTDSETLSRLILSVRRGLFWVSVGYFWMGRYSKIPAGWKQKAGGMLCQLSLFLKRRANITVATSAEEFVIKIKRRRNRQLLLKMHSIRLGFA